MGPREQTSKPRSTLHALVSDTLTAWQMKRTVETWMSKKSVSYVGANSIAAILRIGTFEVDLGLSTSDECKLTVVSL